MIFALAPDTLIENDGCICVEAMDYAEAKKTEEAHWQHIYGYGKTIGSLKVTPSTATFEKAEEAPSVTYRIYAKTAGKYEMELFTAPNNPVVYQGKMCVAYKVNNAETSSYLASTPQRETSPTRGRIRLAA